MARVVTQVPAPRYYDRYPWHEWLDGQLWELSRDTDFNDPVEALRKYAWSAAKSRGLRAITRVVNGNLYVRAVPRQAKT